MIKHLVIKNYALIENLEMEPSSHLNVITGETGAGKSIMLGALGLLLGNRADTKSLFDQERKCLIEAVFDIKEYDLKRLFDDADLDYENECIVRREIGANGKSRAFVNDTPVNLEVLRNLGNRLVDIHSQNETLNLADGNFQLGVIDQFAESTELRKKYRASFNEYLKSKKTLEDLLKNEGDLKKEFDFNSFQLKELTEAELDDTDLESLQSKLEVLENAGEIKLKFGQATQILDESEYSVSQNLSQLLNELKSIKDYSSEYNQLYERLYSSYLELDDITKEISNLDGRIEVNEEELQLTGERVDLLQRLLQKHQVNTITELISIRDEIQNSVSQVENLDEEISNTEKETEVLYQKAIEIGQKLSEQRQKSFSKLEKKLVGLLSNLGMADSQIEINRSESELSSTGLDSISILFSANKGISPQPLKNVASGGEFSRLMFCIKYVLAEKTALPTMIFDEIDTGVSGEIALKMIQMMKQMSTNHQVISISHLPQFAAGGDAHYFVYKDNSADRSISKIKRLSADERIESIAKMISGDNITESALESARELLAN
ncbi:MAG: DNA repair protein RecN [bacterium]|nr:DNA repair protein RecN [bacterium]